MVQITQLLRRAAQTRPAGVATECEGRTRTWSEFQSRVARLAGALGGLGLKPGDRIGILALNSDRYLEFFFAASWGGFVFVPINTRLAPPEIEYWLSDSECAALFIDDNFLPVWPGIRGQLPLVKHVVRVGDGAAPEGMLAYEALASAAAEAPDAGRGGDDLAGIFYTGGTTGRSKGVMLSHRNLIANALFCAAAFGIDSSVVYLHAGPMFHLADGASTFLVTALGGKHAFMSRFEPAQFLATVEKYRVTATLLVPTMINMVVHHPDIEKADVSSLALVLYGASPMPEAVIRRAFSALPRTGFIQAYGQSEAAPCMVFQTPDYHVLEGPKAGKLKAAGRPACQIASKRDPVIASNSDPVGA